MCGRTARQGADIQGHHVIDQQVLRREAPGFLWDERLGLPVCEEPCHRQHTTAMKRIPRRCLPPETIAAVEEIEASGATGIMARLETTYPRET